MKRSRQRLSRNIKARKQREGRAALAPWSRYRGLLGTRRSFGKREPAARAWVYILKLPMGRFYIGKTERQELTSRMGDHSVGRVPLTAGVYPPVGVNAFPVERDCARSIEARLKGWYVEQVGPCRGRGGGYEEPWDQKRDFPFHPVPSWIDYDYEPAMNAERLRSVTKPPTPEALANKRLETVPLPDKMRRPACPLCKKKMNDVKRREDGSLAFWPAKTTRSAGARQK